MRGEAIFDDYSIYYDLFYTDKNYEAEVDYIELLLNKYRATGKDILEFGSGTGRHGCLLGEKGYTVKGIEKSNEMIQRSAVNAGFSCENGDICTVRLGKKYDAVLSIFHVMSYQIANESICSAFETAAEHLDCGGLFIFDFWYSPAVYTQYPEVRVKRMSSDDLNITRIAEPYVYANENRVDVKYTIILQDSVDNVYKSFEEIHSMRHYSLPELDYIAENSGFERLCAEEFLTGEKPGENTWGVCIVLRKK